MVTQRVAGAPNLGKLRRASLRVRLIEPAAPSINILSHGFYPQLGLPIIDAALKACDGLTAVGQRC